MKVTEENLRPSSFQIKFLLLIWAALCPLFSSYAEYEEEQIDPQAQLEMIRRAVSDRLSKKLRTADRTFLKTTVLKPNDRTALRLASAVANQIRETLSQFQVKNVLMARDVMISALTLDEFRKHVVNQKSDLVVASILKPESFEFLLYDRRAPYNVYLQSEEIAPEDMQAMDANLAAAYAEQGTRRMLYSYVREQYYELPRDEKAKFLDVQISRNIASQEMVNVINHEATRPNYVSALLGASLTFSRNDMDELKTWQASVLSLEVGYRIGDRTFFEGAIDALSYYAVGANLKYGFWDRDSSYRITAGIGAAFTISKSALSWDHARTKDVPGFYIVPSLAIQLPIIDAYLQAEVKAHVGMGAYAILLMPGVYIPF